MKRLPRIANILGSLALLVGLAVAALLFVPAGDPSSSGLYRWKLPDGQLIVYGSDDRAIWTSPGVVTTVATSLVIVGSLFLLVGRRLRRTHSHREPNVA